MAIPIFAKRMKQRSFRLSLRIDSSDAIGFVKTAIWALQDKIIKHRGSPATAGQHMINVKYAGLAYLPESAITTVSSIAFEDGNP